MKTIFWKPVLTIVLLVLLVTLSPGCGETNTPITTSQPPSTSQTNPILSSSSNLSSPPATKPPLVTMAPSAPKPPIEDKVLFPNGAPPLNREAVLSCIIKSVTNVKNMRVELKLPEVLELASGSLVWSGDFSAGNDIELIHANVRAVKIGAGTIEIRWTGVSELGGLSFYPDWRPAIYVNIAENTAEWRLNPAYTNSTQKLPPNGGNVIITIVPPGQSDTSNLPPPPATSKPIREYPNLDPKLYDLIDAKAQDKLEEFIARFPSYTFVDGKVSVIIDFPPGKAEQVLIAVRKYTTIPDNPKYNSRGWLGAYLPIDSFIPLMAEGSITHIMVSPRAVSQ